MSVGLLQFHLSSDLNLTSKTFLFSPPAGLGCCLPSHGVLPCLPPSQHPHIVNISLLFFFGCFIKFPIDSFCLSHFPEFIPRQVRTILLLKGKSRRSLCGVWDVVARAGLGWNLFLEQISPLPGDGWRDAPCRQCWGREEAAAASRPLVNFYCVVIYDITHLITLFFKAWIVLLEAKLCRGTLMQKAFLSVIQTIAERAVCSFELLPKYGFLPPPSAQS